MKKIKQISALLIVFILIALYVTTIILSFMKSALASGLFLASLFSTFALPVILYAFLIIYRHLHKTDDR